MSEYTIFIDESEIELCTLKFMLVASVRTMENLRILERRVRNLYNQVQGRPEFDLSNKNKQKPRKSCFHYQEDHYCVRFFVLVTILMNSPSIEVGYNIFPKQYFENNIIKIFKNNIWFGQEKELNRTHIIIEKANKRYNPLKDIWNNIEIAPKCRYQSLFLADYAAGLMHDLIKYSAQDRGTEIPRKLMQALRFSIKRIQTHSFTFTKNKIDKFINNPIRYIINDRERVTIK